MKLWTRTVSFTALVFSMVPPVSGHRQTAPWLDEASLDGGLYVEVRHPRVVRNPGPVDVSIVMTNLLGEGDVVVEEVRYLSAAAFDAVVHPRQHVLASKRSSYRSYKTIQHQLEQATAERDRFSVGRLNRQSRSHLLNIGVGRFRDRHRVAPSHLPEVGSSLELAVEIDVVQDGRPRTLHRSVEIPVQPPLPVGAEGAWFAGDQHLHTAFSIDAFFLEGTAELVTDYAQAAQNLGLSWIIITDHTNIDLLLWYKPWLFTLGERMANNFRQRHDYLVLQGQEMGVGALGPFGEPAHMLAYPFTADSTGFLPNPCPGLLFNHVNCEPEQVIIDRINGNGGLGFIAHPFSSGLLSVAAWDVEGDVLGWAGMEIFNSGGAVFGPEDQQSVDWWHQLLNEIEPPEDGRLAERPDFPTRFPVGLGNSDAHQPGRIGNTFTYCRLPGATREHGMLPREDVMEAFVNGRCVASSGPLVFGEIDSAGTGEVAVLSPCHNNLAVTLQTTPEFGPVGDYTTTVLVDGVQRTVVPPSGSAEYQATIVLDDLLSPPDKFVTLRTERTNCPDCPTDWIAYQAIANPIWLEFRNENQQIGQACGPPHP
jgi:hypothetical protein